MTPLHLPFPLSIFSRVSSLFYMDFLSSSCTRDWSAFASLPWICNTSSNTNRPSQMPFPKCKHTHTWACTANKCDETQIYWHVVVCASRHGLCERMAINSVWFWSLCSFLFCADYFKFLIIPLRTLFFSIILCQFVVFPFLVYQAVRYLFYYSRTSWVLDCVLILLRNSFVINVALDPII